MTPPPQTRDTLPYENGALGTPRPLSIPHASNAGECPDPAPALDISAVAHQVRPVAALRLFVAAVPLVLSFAWLAALAAAHTALPVDLTIARAVQSVHLPLYDWALVHVSDLGYGLPGLLTYVVVGGLLVAGGQRREALIGVVAALLASLSSTAIKVAVGRPRPSPDLVHVARVLHDYGFPSGHVVHYTVLFGFALYALVARPGRPGLRTTTGIVLAGLIVLVGPSRVYLGAHWPTDALGGYVLGGFWVILAIAVDRLTATRTTRG